MNSRLFGKIQNSIKFDENCIMLILLVEIYRSLHQILLLIEYDGIWPGCRTRSVSVPSMLFFILLESTHRTALALCATVVLHYDAVSVVHILI